MGLPLRGRLYIQVPVASLGALWACFMLWLCVVCVPGLGPGRVSPTVQNNRASAAGSAAGLVVVVAFGAAAFASSAAGV
jgi:hypothetical protein